MVFKTKEERDKFIIDNIYLVAPIASNYSKKTGIDVGELMSYGYEGLIKGVDNYDVSLGKPAAYLYKYIIGYILTGMCSMEDICGKNVYHKYIEAKKEIEEKLFTTVEDDPSIFNEIVNIMMDRYKVSRKQCEIIENNVLGKMTEPLQQHKHDLIYPEEVQFYQATSSIREDAISGFMDKVKLSWTEREVITEVFGLDGDGPKTLKEVAEKHRYSQEGIRKIQNRALRKLSSFEIIQELYPYFEIINDYVYAGEMIDISKAKRK